MGGVSDHGGGDPLGSNLFLGSQELADHHLTIALVIIAAICLVGFTLCAVAAAVTTYRRVQKTTTLAQNIIEKLA